MKELKNFDTFSSFVGSYGSIDASKSDDQFIDEILAKESTNNLTDCQTDDNAAKEIMKIETVFKSK